MRILLTIFSISLAYFCNGQKYALIDRTFFGDIKLVDTFNAKKLNSHIFVMRQIDLDTLINLVSRFQNLHDQGMDKVFHNPVMSKETASFNYSLVTVPMPYGYRYDIILLSNTGSSKSKWRISDASLSNKVNQNTTRHLYKYLVKQRQKLTTTNNY